MARNFIKKEAPAQVFSCEFCDAIPLPFPGAKIFFPRKIGNFFFLKMRITYEAFFSKFAISAVN